MICNTCNTKMKCVYTVPVSQTRYRVYKCQNCRTFQETIEVDIFGIADVATIKSRAEEGRRIRYGTLKRLKAKPQ